MNVDGFQTLPFPKDEDTVYVLFFRSRGREPVPFYVGESRRINRRIQEYATANFAACTDFKVGMAVRAIQASGFEVFVHFGPCADRKQRERELIRRYKAEGYHLLNDEPSYDYKTAKRDVETDRILRFVERVTSDQRSHI